MGVALKYFVDIKKLRQIVEFCGEYYLLKMVVPFNKQMLDAHNRLRRQVYIYYCFIKIFVKLEVSKILNLTIHIIRRTRPSVHSSIHLFICRVPFAR